MVCAKHPVVASCGILALMSVTPFDSGLYAQTFESRIFPRVGFATWAVKELGELAWEYSAPSSELALSGSNNSRPQIQEGSF